MGFTCTLCPRSCRAYRGALGTGACGMGEGARISRAALHFYEEPCISGENGSGAIFFSGCSLRCIFCQNYKISHAGWGRDVTAEELYTLCMDLVAQGAHNINLVNPTHFSHLVLQLLKKELPVPVVWNSGGYDSVQTLRQLEGRISVYLPDLKYHSPLLSARFSGAEDYFQKASLALLEMYRQQPALEYDETGLLQRGLLVRHLVLPGHADDSIRLLAWCKEHLPNALISIMGQYTPPDYATPYPALSRRLRQSELDRVLTFASDSGIRGYTQDLSSATDFYLPDFDAFPNTGAHR